MRRHRTIESAAQSSRAPRRDGTPFNRMKLFRRMSEFTPEEHRILVITCPGHFFTHFSRSRFLPSRFRSPPLSECRSKTWSS
jgi:hypothetical protein